MDLFDLDTKKASSEPTRLNLGGDHWIEHLGVDSDEFRNAKTEILQKAEIGELDMAEITPNLIASIVTKWSSVKQCTQKNKADFFKRNPSLCEAVDRSASAKANFTTLLKGSLLNTLKPTRSSKRQSDKPRKRNTTRKSKSAEK
ncbi:MAG: hypothetical protein ACPG8A_03370 [Psychrobium sp.]